MLRFGRNDLRQSSPLTAYRAYPEGWIVAPGKWAAWDGDGKFWSGTDGVGRVGADFWPVQQGDLCPECRETLPHITWVSHKGGTEIRVTTYDSPTRFKYVSGDCGICKQFPCKHVEFDENGNLSFSKE